jgi:DNA-binding NarL/FixJ family response regulator
VLPVETVRRSPKNNKKSRILVVDDHPVVRQGLKLLINQEPELTVCGEAENPQKAFAAIQEQHPDIAIIDLSLAHSSGIDLIKNIKLRYPDLPILVLSMHDESLYAERALRAGARGYIMKQEAPEKVITAIREVLQGKLYVSDAMGAKLLKQFIDRRSTAAASSVELLSDRELEVFQLIGKGLGTRQISEKLNISIKTVEAYRANIKEKLKLTSSAELVQHAIHWVLSEERP